MTKSTILSGTDLSKKYGNLEVVKGVSLAVNEGEFVCLVGKSGCGKTTLLSILSGLEKPTRGKVNLDGREITTSSEDELALFRRDNVGFIFQSRQNGEKGRLAAARFSHEADKFAFLHGQRSPFNYFKISIFLA